MSKSPATQNKQQDQQEATNSTRSDANKASLPTYTLDFLHSVGIQMTAGTHNGLMSNTHNIPSVATHLSAPTSQPIGTQSQATNERKHLPHYHYSGYHQRTDTFDCPSSIVGYTAMQSTDYRPHTQSHQRYPHNASTNNNNYDYQNYGISRKYYNPNFYNKKNVQTNNRFGKNFNENVGASANSPSVGVSTSNNSNNNTNLSNQGMRRVSYSSVASTSSTTHQPPARNAKSVSPSEQSSAAPTNLLANKLLTTSMPSINGRTRSSGSSNSSAVSASSYMPHEYETDLPNINYRRSFGNSVLGDYMVPNGLTTSVRPFNYKYVSPPDLTKPPPQKNSALLSIPSINFSTLSPTEPILSPNIGFYGSQQNLTVCSENAATKIAAQTNTSTGIGSTNSLTKTTNYSRGSAKDERPILSATNKESDQSAGACQQPKRDHTGRHSSASKTYRSGGNRNKNGNNQQQTVPPLTSNSSLSKSTTHRNHNSVGDIYSHHHHLYTPPDRFLIRSHLIELKTRPAGLLNGTKWDSLSAMIWNKFIGAQQTEDTYKKKMYLWRYLYVCVKKMYPRYGLYLVGSTISGFGSDTSDVDMCLVSRLITGFDPRLEAMMHLKHLQDHLTNTSGIFDTFNLIQARVPILRFKDTLHLLEVDLNFNNCVGVRNTHLLYCYSQMDWRLRPLALVVKLWAQFHHINNAKNMTISSYSLVLMTIHFLQYAVVPAILPCLHTMYPHKFQKHHDINSIDMNEDIGPFESQNKQTLGELFLQFLGYYSSFDYGQHAISIRTASVIPIVNCRLAPSPKNDPHQWQVLCIEEPFDLTNTARSVYDVETFDRIKDVFVTSFHRLKETMNLNALFEMSFLQPPQSLASLVNSNVS